MNVLPLLKLKSTLQISAAIAAFTVFQANQAHATVFDVNASGTWSTPATWSPSGTPGALDSINKTLSNGTTNVAVDGTRSVNGITLSSGASNLTFSTGTAGSLSGFTGTISNLSTATLQFDGIGGTLPSEAAFNLQGGTIQLLNGSQATLSGAITYDGSGAQTSATFNLRQNNSLVTRTLSGGIVFQNMGTGFSPRLTSNFVNMDVTGNITGALGDNNFEISPIAGNPTITLSGNNTFTATTGSRLTFMGRTSGDGLQGTLQLNSANAPGAVEKSSSAAQVAQIK